MKTKSCLLYLVSCFLFLVSFPVPSALSQIPQGFNYQAIARDGTGTVLQNTPLQVQLTIQSSSSGGTVFWQELFTSVTTNTFGLFSVVVGTGARQAGLASFDLIDWSVTPKYLMTEIYTSTTGWLTMGTSQLYAVPYAMSAKNLTGTSKLGITGTTANLNEALFEVKNKDGQTVFAVYNEGVRVYVSNGSKGLKGGFAVGGFGTDTKAESTKYLFVDKDSVRIYLDTNPVTKALKGSFAVGGYDLTKGTNSIQRYLDVGSDSVRIYIDSNPATKKLKGGFAVGGYDMTKGTNTNYMNVNTDASGIINPPQNRILWYPLKNAFLTGKVRIGTPDSVGENSFASGYVSKARGAYSQAMGFKAIANGDYSTAIGNKAVATSLSSFAFGDNVTASQSYSYSFGRNSTASGLASFALGTGILAQGSTSLAAGYQCITRGENSVAMGYGSEANGGSSISVGYNNKSDGSFSVALGINNLSSIEACTTLGMDNQATGYVSLSMGKGNIASGQNSVAIGTNTSATALTSMALGNTSEASGIGSFSVGYGTKAQGDKSFAAVYESVASASSSIAMGIRCKASEQSAVALGCYAAAKGLYSVALGGFNVSNGMSSFSTGANTRADAVRSFTGGFYTIAKPYQSFVIGQYNDTSCISPNSWNSYDPLFICGNGTSNDSRTNAFTVLKNGNTAIGHSLPTQMLDVNGNARFRAVGSGALNASLGITSDGTLTTSTSDISMKSNIEPIAEALSKVMEMKGVSFSWKNDASGSRRLGFIAQEMEKVLPEAVFTNPVDGLKGINYEELSAVFAEAIKEQQKQIDELKTMVEKLMER